MTSKGKAPDGIKQKSAVEDDVEGHVKLKAPDGVKQAKATDDDVEGHRKLKAPDGVKQAKATDDVEGHSIGTMDLLLARELTRAKERDIQRAASRANLISEAKRALRRKG